jgi:hypothetical protein
MRAIIISAGLVLALLSVANAAPLYLKCEGKDPLEGSRTEYHSIKIDGATVEVDHQSAGQIKNISDHIWVFGDEKEKISGTIDRITGSTNLSFNWMGRVITDMWGEQDTPTFHGTCRKAEKLF